MNGRAGLLAALVALVLCGVPATAGEIARSEIDGRVIIIDGDGTWKYAEGATPAVDECVGGQVRKSKKLDLSLCISPPWSISNQSQDDFEIFFQNRDSEIYGGVITERGSFPLEALEYAIIVNAAGASGVAEQDVPVIARAKKMLNGVEWNYMEYDVDIRGAKFRFGNYHVSLGENGTAQIAFWSARNYFDSNRPVIEQLAATLRVSTASPQ